MTNCIRRVQPPSKFEELKRCRRKARFFGRFGGGGMCELHALEIVREFGVDQFHAEFRDRLTAALAKQEDRTYG